MRADVGTEKTNVCGGSTEVQLRDHVFHLYISIVIPLVRPHGKTRDNREKRTYENQLAPWQASQALMREYTTVLHLHKSPASPGLLGPT